MIGRAMSGTVRDGAGSRRPTIGECALKAAEAVPIMRLLALEPSEC